MAEYVYIRMEDLANSLRMRLFISGRHMKDLTKLTVEECVYIRMKDLVCSFCARVCISGIHMKDLAYSLLWENVYTYV